MTEGLSGLSPPSKASFMTFIKHLKQRPQKDDDYTASLSTSPSAFSPYLNPTNAAPPFSHSQSKPHGSRPRLPHMSHSSSAVTTLRKPSPSYLNDVNNSSNSNKVIFGVSLQESVNCACATIQIRDKNNQNAVGRIPVIVANCARFLKKDATRVEGIFRLSGSARRIKELQAILTDPNQNYGKDLDWSPYTVHDAANLLRRYLNYLPEPIIPLDFYNKFREPLDNYPSIVEHLQGKNAISATTPPSSAAISPLMKSSDESDIIAISALQQQSSPTQVSPVESKAESNTSSVDPTTITVTAPPSISSETTSPKISSTSENSMFKPKPAVDKVQLKKETKAAIKEYRDLIDQLPILNQQLLLYILDLLFTFSQESEINLMPAVNLASIFQPSILSHPDHNLSPNEYHLSRAVTEFLIEHFLQLTPSVHTWVDNTKAQEIKKQPTHSLIVPMQRRHSKSMSSVVMPSSLNDLNGIIAKDPLVSMPPPLTAKERSMSQITSKQLKLSYSRTLSSESLNKPNGCTSSPPISPPISPAEKSSSGFFNAIKRGTSLTRRRTSSSSTVSSIFGLDQSNTSNSSLSRQATYQLPKQRSSSIPNATNELSEADELTEATEELNDQPNPNAINTDTTFKPPQKSHSVVTITPNRKSALPNAGKPPLIVTSRGPSETVSVTSEPELSENYLSEVSESSKVGPKNSDQSKRHRRSISNLLSRRSGSPSLSLGHSFRKIDNQRMFASSSELPASIDSTLASPYANSNNGLSPSEVQLGSSPRFRSLAFFGGAHSNDSNSSIGLESDEDGSNFSGGNESFRSRLSVSNSESRSRRDVSRWRRSLMALNIPFPSPDSTEEDRNPMSTYDTTTATQTLSPTNSGDLPGTPGSRWLRRLNRRKRTEADESTASATQDTSDSGFSS